MKITSTAFKEGEWIPKEYTARGKDISPELHIHGIKKNGVSMAITMDDASHPLFPNYNHWVIWNLPVQELVPAGIHKGEFVQELPGAVQGIAYGKHCYKGPKPPFKTIHKYKFTVYILDCNLKLHGTSTKEDILKAIEGHILDQGTLCGKFQSHRKEC
ncbi:MAG TPA: YbhB/YbcL family Raf kinase inhibitor-like protein [Clostridiales bacterium]|nr:YbhB/YbcL family Raf kinase inhibitor-like protein [Clostridiales bacterium]